MTAGSSRLPQSPRPNILLICTDQQRYDTIARLGPRPVHTPNLDRLADGGVAFENAYTASPVCAPSRASMMTGRFPSAHGLWANGVSLPEQTLFTKVLAGDGFRTGLIGKLHLSAAWQGRREDARDDGFEYYRWAHDPKHPAPGNDYHQWLRDEHPELYQRAAGGAGVPPEDPEATGFDMLPAQAHYSRWASTRALEFLAGQRDEARPFFLWVNFFDPHHPFVVPQEYLDRYPADSVSLGIDAETEPPLPAQLESMRSYANAAGARAFGSYSHDELVDVVRAYYAMVTMVDEEIGRILDGLDSAGLTDDTLIVFTSDHGEMLTDHGLLLKGPALYEGAVRVPLVLRWPGVLPAGRRRAALVSLVDLPATILHATGRTETSWHQGESLLPTAIDGDESWTRDWALCQYRDSGRPEKPPAFATMLRQREHKLVVFHGDPATDRARTCQLFDLAADPGERQDLSGDPEHRAVLLDLLGRLTDVMTGLEDRKAERVAPW